MSTAVARQDVSLRGGTATAILLPPLLACVVFVALSASLRSIAPISPRVADPLPTMPPPVPIVLRAPPVATTPPAWAGRLAVATLGASSTSALISRDGAPPGLDLPAGAWSAARTRLRSLAAQTKQTSARSVVAERETTGPADIAAARIAVAPPTADIARPAALVPFDASTAVYEIASHTVYLPDGRRLEAHSGLGARRDDPGSMRERMRGVTPPNVYQIKALDKLFHGVRALRLDPVGNGDMFGRDGMLAHTYMLGPKGDSNGCVVFKDYNAFLKAWDSGIVKKLAVVGRLG